MQKTKQLFSMALARFVTLNACLFLCACGASLQQTNDFSHQSHFSDAPDFMLLTEECFESADYFSENSAIAGPDLWDRIRDGFVLEQISHKRVDQQFNWYARHESYMQRVSKRANRYLFHIVEEIEARDMPLEIALLPIVESAFDPFAYSHGRASGIWQIIPGTGKALGLKQNWWYDGRRDIVASTDAALTYLQSLHKRFDGDWLLALAAYNSGGGNVNKAIRKNKRKGKPTDFWHLDLPRETKAYVPKLLALAKLLRESDENNLELYSIENKPYFKGVATNGQIDLAFAAENAGVDMAELFHLNPAFNRWATDPDGPHTLLVPVARANDFSVSIAKLSDDDRVTWKRYTIKSGDALSTIARKFRVSVDALKSINGLSSHNIRVGKTLMVPISSRPDGHYAYTQDQRRLKKQQASAKRETGHKIEYVVKPGDSFWSIAKRYGVASTKLARWNNMGLRDPIRAGQTLHIWTKLPKAKVSNDAVIRKLSYKVRSGDSLHRIADKFQLRVKDILRWNRVDPSKYLKPGQSLTLFVDVKRTNEG